MKKLVTLACLAAATSLSFGQGIVNFGNSSTTLISAGGTSTPGSATSSFVFAVFMAPSGTTSADFGNSPTPYTDAAFQVAGAYNVNHASAVGRLATTASSAVVNGTPGGGTADFIVRGWSANAGATWAAALAFWNNGNPSQTMYLGESRVGNNLVLGDGGGIPTPTLFGVGGNQVGGFNMVQFNPVPEPTSMALAGLGAASLLIFRRRK